MAYAALADALATLHLAFVLFVLIGQLLIVAGALAGWRWVRNPWFRLLHLLAIGIVVMETVVGIECPLTTWERNLRIAAGQEDFARDASFIGRLVRGVLFCPNDIQPTLNKIYYGFGLLVLLTFVFAPPRLRKPRGHGQLACAGTGEPPVPSESAPPIPALPGRSARTHPDRCSEPGANPGRTGPQSVAR